MRQLASRQRRRIGIAGIGVVTIAGAPSSPLPETARAAEVVAPATTPGSRVPVLPGARHARIDFWIERYSGSQRELFERQMQRRGRYEEMILDKLAARGLPPDLIYLAWIESGFLDTVESHAGAVGLWQFMPATARGMGLRVDDVVDERRDPVRSTEAAVAFLHRLHRRYGSWHLAMAAYNGGPTRVSRIVRSQGAGPWGHESLYWQVLEHLPQETGHYVPRFLAVRALAEAMEADGFEPSPVEPYAYSVVWIDRVWTFRDIAAATGITVEALRDLNPHLIADRTPSGAGPYPLRVPVGSSIRVASRLVRPDRDYALADD
jgi:membrane-bound lytic murein transglycosylase D